MKKIIIIFSVLFLLTSCYSNPEDLEKIKELESKINELESKESFNVLEKKALCLEKSYIFKENFTELQLNWLRDISYSPILNSCIAEFSYTWLEKNWENYDNYLNKYIYDYLSDKYIWRIAYYEEFWFEDPWYLPSICDINFMNLELDKDIIYITSYWTSKKEDLQKIQNTEYIYNNCINYLKWNNEQKQVSMYNHIIWTIDKYNEDINTPIIFK